MMQQHMEEIDGAAQTIKKGAAKLEDGINNVIEPELKDTRISAYESARKMEILNRRITVLVALSVVINVVGVVTHLVLNHSS